MCCGHRSPAIEPDLSKKNIQSKLDEFCVLGLGEKCTGFLQAGGQVITNGAAARINIREVKEKQKISCWVYPLKISHFQVKIKARLFLS